MRISAILKLVALLGVNFCVATDAAGCADFVAVKSVPAAFTVSATITEAKIEKKRNAIFFIIALLGSYIIYCVSVGRSSHKFPQDALNYYLFCAM